MIYIGEHTLTKEEIIKHFTKTIHFVNSTYCEINVHGFLLVYDSYFVHIIEVSTGKLIEGKAMCVFNSKYIIISKYITTT